MGEVITLVRAAQNNALRMEDLSSGNCNEFIEATSELQ